MTYRSSARISFGSYYRTSPFFQATLRAGAVAYDIYNKMYIPSHYVEDPVEEYWHLLNHVTMWDVGCERQVEIRGRDGFRFAQYLVARDLSTCQVGEAKYVILTTDEGGIVNDPVLTRLGENRFWLSTADSDVLLWAKGIAHDTDFEVELSEPDVSPLQIQGPKSRDLLADMFGPKVLELKYYTFAEAEVDGIPVLITRTGWSAEVGYEVYLRDGSKGDRLWNLLMEAGRKYNLRPTGPIEARRVEAGILNYPSDINLDTNPYEVGLGWLVDLEKRDEFIGRERLRQIKKAGVKRKLVGFEMPGAPMQGWLPWFWPITKDGQVIGKATALVHSPRLAKNIGYGMVPTEHAALGTTFVIETPDGPRDALVVRKPFIDPKKDIPKS